VFLKNLGWNYYKTRNQTKKKKQILANNQKKKKKNFRMRERAYR
jgi:hypothetical protein